MVVDHLKEDITLIADSNKATAIDIDFLKTRGNNLNSFSALKKQI